MAAALGLCLALAASTASHANETALLAEAVALYKGDRTTLEGARAIRDILDRIVADHPATTLAADVLFGNPVGGIDVAVIDRRLREARKARQAALTVLAASAAAPAPAAPDTSAALEAPPPQVGPASSDVANPPPVIGSAGDVAAPLAPATELSEAAMALDKQAIRDIQARLLVLGFDPNGIDGEAGRGTRAAISAWQESVALPVTGFIDVAQRQRLTSASQRALSEWLALPENQKLYNPPPPVPLSAESVSGDWTFATSCGSKSRFPGRKMSGAMRIQLAADGSFSGPVRNSQGFEGTISGQLRGRSVEGRIEMGILVGNPRFTGRVRDDSLTIVGRDSNGCSLTVRKG
ncbi:MAG: peptidoglycan-binding domain-containing protein [Gemmobacter sp.]